MVHYMRCLRQNSNQHTECRLLAKDYLQCRMDKYVLNVCILPGTYCKFYILICCFLSVELLCITDISNCANKIEC